MWHTHEFLKRVSQEGFYRLESYMYRRRGQARSCPESLRGDHVFFSDATRLRVHDAARWVALDLAQVFAVFRLPFAFLYCVELGPTMSYSWMDPRPDPRRPKRGQREDAAPTPEESNDCSPALRGSKRRRKALGPVNANTVHNGPRSSSASASTSKRPSPVDDNGKAPATTQGYQIISLSLPPNAPLCLTISTSLLSRSSHHITEESTALESKLRWHRCLLVSYRGWEQPEASAERGWARGRAGAGLCPQEGGGGDSRSCTVMATRRI